MEDGYRCAEICDAIVRSHETGQRADDRVPHAMTAVARSSPARRRASARRPRSRSPAQAPTSSAPTGRAPTRGEQAAAAETVAAVEALGRRCVLVEADAARSRRRPSASRGSRATSSAGSTSGSTTPRGCSCGRSSRPPTRTGPRSCGSNVHRLRLRLPRRRSRRCSQARRRPDRQHHVGRAPAADRRSHGLLHGEGRGARAHADARRRVRRRAGSRSTRSRRARSTRRSTRSPTRRRCARPTRSASRSGASPAPEEIADADRLPRLATPRAT